ADCVTSLRPHTWWRSVWLLQLLCPLLPKPNRRILPQFYLRAPRRRDTLPLRELELARVA
ncbi:MAG TPA: hypothetical protein VNB49_05070, partial [Candidatus Dormibacteraeota bacterium]|nr:hypothetical protein [Candidatus Dormibacteraeota bacterium]